MRSNQVDLSIIIPFYHGEKFYFKLLKSITQSISRSSAFGLTYEIITIIDSPDTERDVIHETAEAVVSGVSEVNLITIKNNGNIGVAGSRNIAIRLAQGNFLHIIDQDDYVDESFYSTVIPLSKTHNFIMVNGLVKYLNSRYNEHKLLYFKPNLSLKGLIKDDFIRSPGQIVFSRQFVQEFQFPEPKSFKGADDRFFWLRIFFKYEKLLNVVFVKRPLYIAVIHGSNFSDDTASLRKSSLENWGLLLPEIDYLMYERLIRSDINSLKFAIGENMNVFDTVSGIFNRVLYFLDLNKIVRFYHKRIRI